MAQLLQIPFLLKKQGTLPGFIIIGGMKCGTTSLHYYLDCHPEICMSQEKELKFFVESNNWKKGVEWYKCQFTGNAKVYGEASPAYTKYPLFPGVAERMYSIIPQAKLIYILRDPIERIISHYVHKYAQGRENRSITEALADFAENIHNIYVCRSRYYWQLEQYLLYFSSDNILILTTEELYHYPENILQVITKFLDVSHKISSINYHKKIHESAFKRKKNNLGNTIAQWPIMSQINYLPPRIRYHVNELIYFPFSVPVKKPILEQNLRNRLIEYLKPDVDKLRKYTGKELEKWRV